jgi:hypothetical protein
MSQYLNSSNPLKPNIQKSNKDLVKEARSEDLTIKPLFFWWKIWFEVQARKLVMNSIKK